MNVFNRVTWRTLWKNRTRTVVTIVGILLSTAMFTAVTTSISSLRQYLERSAVYNSGQWHVAFENLPARDLPELTGDPLVESAACAQDLGYSAVENANPDKPYLFVLGGDQRFFARMPIHLTEGRLPETSGELLLPEHLIQDGQAEFRLGDVITLELGRRMVEGEPLYQYNPYLDGEDGAPQESLEADTTRTFTVVGIYQRPSFETYSAPGYTAITCWDGDSPAPTVSAWLCLHRPALAFDFSTGEAEGQQYPPDACSSTTNSDLLLAMGHSRYDTFYRVLYSMAAILMGLIVFGSVSLIYNAFSISVSERTRQFGLLASVGATPRQIRRMVRTEALLVSGIGIPLGLLAGVGGIWVTLLCIGKKISSLYGASELSMTLAVSPAALLIAAAAAFLTVLLSAWIPSRRAMRVPPMEAIRQTGDVSIRRKQVKTSPLTYRLFGLEGMLASKHFRRNRRRYRATVFSLFLSVVLFISAGSFCAYMTEAVVGTFEKSDYDISYSWSGDSAGEEGGALSPERVLETVSGTAHVIRASAVVSYMGDTMELDRELLPEETARILLSESGTYTTNLVLYGVDEASYRAYLREQGLDPADYLDTEQPKAVVLSRSRSFNTESGRVETMEMLDSSVRELTASFCNAERYGAYFEVHDASEMDEADWDAAREAWSDTMTFTLGARVTELPFGLNRTEYWGICLIYPMDYLRQHMAASATFEVYCKTEDHTAAMAALEEAAKDAGIPADGFYDAYAATENERNLVLVVKVFAYGFIVLISMISMANVFNTISTNILLRRRELAMLRSVGMTRGGFRRMLDFECLLYGLKALLFGLPVAAAVTYLIFRSIGFAYDTDFYLPWTPVAVAVGGVFLVVFASMLYGMRRIQRDNPVDALRSELL